MKELERAVFPVFRFRSLYDEKTRSRDGDYLGTGFFVEHDDHVVFVTARHVVDVDPQDGFVGIGDLTDNSKHDWGGFEYHPSADLAIAIFDRTKAPSFVEPLSLSHVGLDLGAGVASYGFPLSGAKRHEGSRNLVKIEQMFFRGHVVTDWAGEDIADMVPRSFAVNYGLSFSAPRGLSGAPLLVESTEGTPTVAGMIYGNRTIEFQVRSYEELARDGAKERNVEFDAHHFGLAADLAELLAMIEAGDA
jgi:hypothetical protein